MTIRLNSAEKTMHVPQETNHSDFAIHSSWEHFGGKKRWKREDFESQGQVCRIAVLTHGHDDGFSEMTRK